MRGLDVSAKTYRRADGTEVPLGRWVEGNGKLTPEDSYGAHQDWTPQFNAQWEAFFEAEKGVLDGRMRTPEEIIDKMVTMRNSGQYPSRGWPQ